MSAEENARTWLNLLGELLVGESVHTRELTVRERLNVITQWDMRYPVLALRSRRLNYQFMAQETLSVLTGSNLLAPLAKSCGGIMKYSDDGVHMRGAYGPKFVDQVEYVVGALADDSATRRALMTFWRESPRPSKNIPCTIALHPMIRLDKLQMTVFMRSSDAYLGIPYDVHCFSFIAHYILACLRYHAAVSPFLDIGTLTIIATSQHIYETDVQRVKDLMPVDLALDLDPVRSQRSPIFSYPQGVIDYLKERA